ncbi:MAG TPA: DoxX family protein [Pseudolabrys sp.]|nr:DoxX family protein [Pseudolabrys sp.]
MTARAGSEPKLLLPGLSDFYASVADLWYPMIRFVAGAFLLYHGLGKLLGGAGPVIAAMAKYHIEPSVPAAYIVIFLETVGALCVALGLFTRFFAAGIAIEMAVIAFVAKAPLGFGQMELFLLWGTVMFAIALRGGGPYSIDRAIGKEL